MPLTLYADTFGLNGVSPLGMLFTLTYHDGATLDAVYSPHQKEQVIVIRHYMLILAIPIMY